MGASRGCDEVYSSEVRAPASRGDCADPAAETTELQSRRPQGIAATTVNFAGPAGGFIERRFEVADSLGISVRTAETHRASILRKLNLDSIAGLVRYAIRNKIIEP